MINTRDTLKIDENNNLIIGGVTCSELVKKYGTPLYVMDKAHIKNMCKAFIDPYKKVYNHAMITYASKAFCCKEIYRIMNECGMGIDAVSIGELATALSVKFPANRIIYHGNNKTPEELEYVVKKRIKYIVIDSLDEIEELDRITLEKNIIQKVLIRVNPGVEAHTHHYIQTSKVDSKFGFSISDGAAFEAIIKTRKCKNLRLKGLHCHIGSQIFDKNAFKLAMDKMTDFYCDLNVNHNINFDTIDFGGGFGIYYSNDDVKMKYEDYSKIVKEMCMNLMNVAEYKNIDDPFLILEPGRSIVGEAGITLYTIGSIKEIKNVKNYIAIDGGMFENPRYALYQAKYTVVPTENLDRKFDKKYSIAGKCCESGDLIAEDVMLPEMKKGDILAVLSTGAYNYSMSSNYNRNTIPAVVFVENGESYLAVKRQTVKDLMRNDL